VRIRPRECSLRGASDRQNKAKDKEPHRAH
jgi:hypothetical protein